MLRATLLVSLVLLDAAIGSAIEAREPIPVTQSISIRHGDWVPLPVEDMRRAAGDSALSRLTDAGLLRVVMGPGKPDLGSLALEVSLIGPAQTMKLTITLNVPGSPTLLSTASISVRNLDHAGIYGAFEHVGARAADRLVAKLDLLRDAFLGDVARPSGATDDPTRRQAYDAAQAAKRAGRYSEARALFEAIVSSASARSDSLRQLAEDELRYGLPVFEAQQSLNTLGRLSLPGQQGAREAAFVRAENLYRQIQAENPSDVQRVSEAQRALDSLIVARGALANAMRASALSRVHSLRMAILEHMMMEGGCPDRARVQRLVKRMNVKVNVDDATPEGAAGQRYRLFDPESRTKITLLCNEFGVEIVTTGPDSSRAPAAFR
jgi:hypothetical protein